MVRLWKKGRNGNLDGRLVVSNTARKALTLVEERVKKDVRKAYKKSSQEKDWNPLCSTAFG
jgi:hypothetical protein